MKSIFFTKGFWLCILISFSMGSCKHGCTFTSVLKTKSKNEKVGSQDIEIKASLLKSKNIKFKWRGGQISRSDVYHTVSVEAFINKNDLHLDWYFPAEKSTDLKPFLEKISIQKKKDNSYFVIEYADDKELASLFQVLGNGSVILSPYLKDYLDKKRNLESLPSEKQLISDLIQDPMLYTNAMGHQDLLLAWFSNQKLSEEQCIKLLEHFDSKNSKLAEVYFTDKRLAELKYSYVEFRKKALSKALSALEKYDPSEPMQKIILALADQQSFDKADEIIVNKWGDAFSDKSDDYLKLRLLNRSLQMNSQLRQQLNERCEKAIDMELKNETISKVTAENAAKYMLWISNKVYVEKYAAYLFEKNKEDQYSQRRIVENYYQMLSPGLKQKIMENCKKQFSEKLTSNDEMEVADWYNLMDKGLTCMEMRSYFKQFKYKYKKSTFLNKEPKC
jgi:hypothetical protein